MPRQDGGVEYKRAMTSSRLLGPSSHLTPPGTLLGPFFGGTRAWVMAQFLNFFARLTSAMALRLGRPPEEHIQDPKVFTDQFVVLCLELKRGADATGYSVQESEEDGLNNPEATGIEHGPKAERMEMANLEKLKELANEGCCVDTEVLVGLDERGGALPSFTGSAHELGAIFGVFDPPQLHRHIKWLAARVEAARSRGKRAKLELRALKETLGVFDDPLPFDAAQRLPPLFDAAGRVKRTAELLQALHEAAGESTKEQWELKARVQVQASATPPTTAVKLFLDPKDAAPPKPSVAAQAAAADEKGKKQSRRMSTDSLLLAEKHEADRLEREAKRAKSLALLDDAYERGERVAQVSADLVEEWQGVLSLLAAAEAKEDAEYAAALSVRASAFPVSPWCRADSGWGKALVKPPSWQQNAESGSGAPEGNQGVLIRRVYKVGNRVKVVKEGSSKRGKAGTVLDDSKPEILKVKLDGESDAKFYSPDELRLLRT
mmetsp:Transcript_3336/g.7703  ORF Transcript_3336/g.7703 Transcript_3336/m.7703 type:complete len:490 (+) Transcript_3336:1777-3246(+)